MSVVEDSKCNPVALVVDDDCQMTRLLGAFLQDVGFQTIAAHDGLQGEKVFMEKHPDLVVSDIHMPGQNGLILLKKIKHVSPHTVVILITGHQHYEQLVSYSKTPPDGFFVKPFDVDRFLDSIRLAFYNARMQQNMRIRTRNEVVH